MRNILFGAGTLGLAATATSLHSNQYNVDSIGIVRFGRASFAVQFKNLYQFSCTLPITSFDFIILEFAGTHRCILLQNEVIWAGKKAG